MLLLDRIWNPIENLPYSIIKFRPPLNCWKNDYLNYKFWFGQVANHRKCKPDCFSK